MTSLFSLYSIGSINFISVHGFPIKEKSFRQTHYCESFAEWNHFMDFGYFVIFCHLFQCDWSHFIAQKLPSQLSKCSNSLFNLVTTNSYFFIDPRSMNCLFFLLLFHQTVAFFSCNFVRISIVLILQFIISLYQVENWLISRFMSNNYYQLLINFYFFA